MCGWTQGESRIALGKNKSVLMEDRMLKDDRKRQDKPLTIFDDEGNRLG
jgi:hypothetical protein